MKMIAVPMGFSKLLLTCTVVPLLPPPAPVSRTWGVHLGVFGGRMLFIRPLQALSWPRFWCFERLNFCNMELAAYFLQLCVFRSVEVALHWPLGAFCPPPPPRQSAVCKMPSCLACLHPVFSGVEPALRPRLVRSFFCYTVQVALHPGFLSFDLL